MTEAKPYFKRESGPSAYAFRLASYLKDPNYIRSMVLREHSNAPTVSEIKGYVAWHIKDREKFKRQADNRDIGQAALNDNGGHYEVPYIGPDPKPRRKVKAYRRWNGGQSFVTVNEIRAENAPRALSVPFTAKNLVHSVAHAFGVSYQDVMGAGRNRVLVCARSVVAKLLRERSTLAFSYPRIAQILGRKDHSTVINYLKTWDKRIRQEPAMLEVYRALGGAE